MTKAKQSPLSANAQLFEGLTDSLGKPVIQGSISRELQLYLNQFEPLHVQSGTNQYGIHPQTDGTIRIGDGITNYAKFDTDGEITLYGTAKITKIIPLPIATGGGTTTVSLITGTSSIDFNADGETAYTKFYVPKDWDAASDFTIKAMVQNEIAETEDDDISFTGTVHGIADGETNADAGQSVSISLNLADGDEGINKVNLVSGTIDYDDTSYPIAVGDSVIIKIAVNLGGAGECTGPLHIIDWWIEYTANKLGEAT